jgi:hypothetical protein
MTATGRSETTPPDPFVAICGLFCASLCRPGGFSDPRSSRRPQQAAGPSALNPLPGRRPRDPKLARDRLARSRSGRNRAAVQHGDALELPTLLRPASSLSLPALAALVECRKVDLDKAALIRDETRILTPRIDFFNRNVGELESRGSNGRTYHRAQRESALGAEHRRIVVEAADCDAFRPFVFQHDFDENSERLLRKPGRERLGHVENTPFNEVRRLVLHPVLAELGVVCFPSQGFEDTPLREL